MNYEVRYANEFECRIVPLTKGEKTLSGIFVTYLFDDHDDWECIGASEVGDEDHIFDLLEKNMLIEEEKERLLKMITIFGQPWEIVETDAITVAEVHQAASKVSREEEFKENILSKSLEELREKREEGVFEVRLRRVGPNEVVPDTQDGHLFNEDGFIKKSDTIWVKDTTDMDIEDVIKSNFNPN